MNEPSSRRILVTGAAGFIGCNLVRRLLSEGHSVLSVDSLTYAGRKDSLPEWGAGSRHEFLEADIGDTAKMQEALGRFAPQWIFNLAAETHVDRSIDDPTVFFQTNVLATVNLLGATLFYWNALPENEKNDFRFIHISTDEVFGQLAEDGKFSENSHYQPRSPYSASKAAADHAVRAWQATYGLPTIITHCANNYGPFQNPEKLIPLVITRLLRGETIPVYGKGLQIRDWIYVADHCAALLRVAQRAAIGESYVIGAEQECRNIDLVEKICDLVEELSPPGAKISDAKSQIRFVVDRPGHDFRYALDSSKIQRDLGWKPRSNFDEGLRETVIWYLENPKFWESEV